MITSQCLLKFRSNDFRSNDFISNNFRNIGSFLKSSIKNTCFRRFVCLLLVGLLSCAPQTTGLFKTATVHAEAMSAAELFGTNDATDSEDEEVVDNHPAYLYMETTYLEENHWFRFVGIFFTRRSIENIGADRAESYIRGLMPEGATLEVSANRKDNYYGFEMSFDATSIDDLRQKTQKALDDPNYQVSFEPTTEQSSELRLKENFDLSTLMGKFAGRFKYFDRNYYFPKGSLIKMPVQRTEGRIETNEQGEKLTYTGLPSGDSELIVQLPLNLSEIAVVTQFNGSGQIKRSMKFFATGEELTRLSRALDLELNDRRISSFDIHNEQGELIGVSYSISGDIETLRALNPYFFKDNQLDFKMTRGNAFSYDVEFSETLFPTQLAKGKVAHFTYDVFGEDHPQLSVGKDSSSQLEGASYRNSNFHLELSGDALNQLDGSQVVHLQFHHSNYTSLFILIGVLLLIGLAIAALIYLVIRMRRRLPERLNYREFFEQALSTQAHPPLLRGLGRSKPGLTSWQHNTRTGEQVYFDVPTKPDGSVDPDLIDQSYAWLKDTLNYPEIHRYLYYAFPISGDMTEAHPDHLQIGIYEDRSIHAQFQLQIMLDDEVVGMNFAKIYSPRSDRELMKLLQYTFTHRTLPGLCVTFEPEADL